MKSHIRNLVVETICHFLAKKRLDQSEKLSLWIFAEFAKKKKNTKISFPCVEVGWVISLITASLRRMFTTDSTHVNRNVLDSVVVAVRLSVCTRMVFTLCFFIFVPMSSISFFLYLGILLHY